MAHPLLAAVRSVADAVGGVRLTEGSRDIDRYLTGVEREPGAPMAQASLGGKQRAVKRLNGRGAFQLRTSVEQVLAMGRFRVYENLSRPESTA